FTQTLLSPIEELRNRINLVIVPPIRERKNFCKKSIEPVRFTGKINVSGLDFSRWYSHPFDLGANGLNSNRACHSWWEVEAEVLQHLKAGARFFDQKCRGPIFLGQGNDCPTKGRVFEPFSAHVEQIKIIADDSPCRTNRKIMLNVGEHRS